LYDDIPTTGGIGKGIEECDVFPPDVECRSEGIKVGSHGKCAPQSASGWTKHRFTVCS
jgi:hypothetical protein